MRWDGLPFAPSAPGKGRVLAGVSFVAEQIHPEPTGASTVIRHVENQEMAETAAALTEALGCLRLRQLRFHAQHRG